MATTRWRINRSRATYQNLDGEVIIVDLVNGYYYSLLHSAAVLWDALEHEPTAVEVASVFGSDAAAALPLLEKVLDDLKQYELVEPFDSQESQSRTLPVAPAAWKTPEFQAYSDMQNLLLADPIHDVDNEGWPRLTPGRG